MEWINADRNTEAIARRFFASKEYEEISRSDDRLSSFFSVWTKKEAYAKLCGKGLASVCSDEISSEVFYSQYRVELKGRKGILTICHRIYDEITVINQNENLNIYKLKQ